MKHPATEIELHSAQTAALHVLLFRPEATYGELNVAGLGSDHFNFHVQRLLETGLIAKSANGRYSLTVAGKEFANRYDTDRQVIERQGKVAVCLLISKEEKGDRYYLIQQRLKQPYYGFYGKPTGKIKWGEGILEGAARELEEETGLLAELRLAGIEHKIDRDPEGRILEDKYFFMVEGVNPEGEFKEEFEGGRNYWMTKQEMVELSPSFGNLAAIYDRVQKKEVAYWENNYLAEQY